MMSNKNISFQKNDAIGIITLNRPAAGNAVNMAMATELAELCNTLDHDTEIKVVIITGAGNEAFCAGTDLEEVALTRNSRSELRLPYVASSIAGLKIPVIAAINGDALGQGLELALACDLRIAVDTAHFALPQVTKGLLPWDGATQRLPRLVGRAIAMEMILTGQVIDASQAHKTGLVNRVLNREEMMPVVIETAKDMAEKAYWPLRYAKEAATKGMDMTLEQGLRLESDLYFLLQTTEDRTEGIKAFQKKRPPHFKGK